MKKIIFIICILLLITGCDIENICIQTGEIVKDGNTLHPTTIQIQRGVCEDIKGVKNITVTNITLDNVINNNDNLVYLYD